MARISILLIISVAVIGARSHCPNLRGKGASKGAARCAYLGTKCGPREAGHVCYRYTSAYRQSWLCRAHACAFCKCHPTYWPCQTRLFLRACLFTTGAPKDRDYWGKPKRSRTRPKRKSSGRNGKGCSWRTRNGHVVIPAIYAKYSYPWVRRNKCLVWRPKKNSHSIDKPGSGALCYPFKVDKKSPYLFTANTRAPHTTEHNDMWIKMPYRGFRLFKVGSNRYRGWYYKGWLKAYQNSGGRKFSNELRTIDFNGHQFETAMLYPGAPYTICISGRSSKYTVCNLHLIACARGTCGSNSRRIQKILSNTRSSDCR